MGRGPGKQKQKQPHQAVNQMPTQIPSRDIPIYSRRQPPLDLEAFVYVEVVIIWPDLERVSLVDVRMVEAKYNPARFYAYFTGDCADFLSNVQPRDQLCLYLAEAAMSEVQEQNKQNTLNLPFTLTYDKACRIKHVERGMAGPLVTFPTRAWPPISSSSSQRLILW